MASALLQLSEVDYDTRTEFETCREIESSDIEAPSTPSTRHYLSSDNIRDVASGDDGVFEQRLGCSDSDGEENGAGPYRYSIELLLCLRSPDRRNRVNRSRAKYSLRSVENLPEWARLKDAVLEVSVQEPTTCADTFGSWTPSSQAWMGRPRSSSESEADRLKRTARSILNKLTLEKFDALYEQLATCGLSTPQHMAILMQEVFEKATSQHHFIGMYADLCAHLEADPRLLSARGPDSGATSFRALLVAQCQSLFLKLLQPPVADIEECEEQSLLRRKTSLGNVKLVGHLVVRGMLSCRLLVACSEALLKDKASCQVSLESLAVLLTVTGKTFDRRKDWLYSDRLDAIFAKISALTKDRKVSARSRFLLRDLLELREAGWPSQI